MEFKEIRVLNPLSISELQIKLKGQRESLKALLIKGGLGEEEAQSKLDELVATTANLGLKVGRNGGLTIVFTEAIVNPDKYEPLDYKNTHKNT